jgi:cytochrome bd-type quinol oxidase subunit 1
MSLDTAMIAMIARIQFEFTVSLHIIFPSISIGVATLKALAQNEGSLELEAQD